MDYTLRKKSTPPKKPVERGKLKHIHNNQHSKILTHKDAKTLSCVFMNENTKDILLA